jgi:hypothetical protein
LGQWVLVQNGAQNPDFVLFTPDFSVLNLAFVFLPQPCTLEVPGCTLPALFVAATSIQKELTKEKVAFMEMCPKFADKCLNLYFYGICNS